MNENFEEFLRITKKLNEEKIIPLLMGSLGLEYLTKRSWDSRDIDIHVKGDHRGWEAPDEDRIHHWGLIVSVMRSLQYALVDLHEHAFYNGAYEVEFGVIDTLPDFAGVDPNELSFIDLDGVCFYLPSVQQYLKIYQSSYQDSYRADHNNHKDLQKIEYLQDMIS